MKNLTVEKLILTATFILDAEFLDSQVIEKHTFTNPCTKTSNKFVSYSEILKNLTVGKLILTATFILDAEFLD